MGHYYTGNCIAAAEKTFFQKNEEKKHRIMTRPARPLKSPKKGIIRDLTLKLGMIARTA